MKGIDIIKEYVTAVTKQHSSEYIEKCEEVLDILKETSIDYETLTDSCPSSYGLDNYKGLCYIDEDSKDRYEQCRNCWKIALESDINETEK